MNFQEEHISEDGEEDGGAAFKAKAEQIEGLQDLELNDSDLGDLLEDLSIEEIEDISSAPRNYTRWKTWECFYYQKGAERPALLIWESVPNQIGT